MEILNTRIYGEVTLHDFLFAALVMALSVIFARVLTRSLRRTLSEKIEKDRLEVILKVIYFGIITVAFLSISPLIGINLSGILVAGGILGIIIGFASQSTVSNLISGIFIILEKPIKIGDAIEVEGIRGVVEDVSILSTIMRTFDGLYVRVPNEKIFVSNIINFTAHVARRFEFMIGVSYSSDIKKAIELIRKIGEEHPFVLKNPEPQVFVYEFGDSSVNLNARFWAPSQVWFSVRMELLERIKKEFDENGIEIPFPQRVIWFGDGSQKISESLEEST
ncbi:MAG: hypothetical protein PWR13_630 [Archaeoglobi archaeon]|nr:mechanosensitive ion channel family protein [Candidatus Mnemosynella bozhongmuii]MDI3501990.1 hypothetical protein [Archaeoglobi archaeon]MDK2781602.1 hypothetical protein [Archaeoglobi archaeon]